MSAGEAIIKAADEGESRWFYGGGVHVWRLGAAETGGSFALFEDVLEKGKVTPWHTHPESEESVYVLEGEILVRAGEIERTIGAGGVTFIPRGVPHAFTVLSERARILCIASPGSVEPFYRRASEPMAASASGPVDFGRIREAAAATGATTVLGPPPFGAPQK